MTSFFRAWLLGILFFVLAFFVFCPRFYFWDPVGSPTLPESYRAFYVLVQLQNSPFVKIPDIGSNVLEWRLLFPVVGYIFHIHWIPFFALAHASVLALLLYVAHVVYARTRSWWAAAIATALAATSSAFFISTGFLGYFDAAMTLALLVTCFSRRRVFIWAAATLAPWIDERFVFALPIALWCQWMQTQDLKAALKLMVPMILGIAPYLLLRVMAMAMNTDHSQGFFHDLFTRFDMQVYKALVGSWDALRWGWAAVILGVFAAWPRATPRRMFWPRLFALTVIPAAMIFLLLSAGDYSRSMMVLLPMVLTGIILSWPQRTAQTMFLLTALAVLNFVMPAYHSFRAFHIQIYPYPLQLKISEIVENLKRQTT